MDQETEVVIGWRDGRYLYCNSHSSEQVYNPQPVKMSDADVYQEVKCAWCNRRLVQ